MKLCNRHSALKRPLTYTGKYCPWCADLADLKAKMNDILRDAEEEYYKGYDAGYATGVEDGKFSHAE